MWNYLISKDRTEQKTENEKSDNIRKHSDKSNDTGISINDINKKMVVLITLEVNDINDRISRKVTVRIIMINDYKWSCW